jgi:hypothetical protein
MNGEGLGELLSFGCLCFVLFFQLWVVTQVLLPNYAFHCTCKFATFNFSKLKKVSEKIKQNSRAGSAAQ